MYQGKSYRCYTCFNQIRVEITQQSLNIPLRIMEIKKQIVCELLLIICMRSVKLLFFTFFLHEDFLKGHWTSITSIFFNLIL